MPWTAVWALAARRPVVAVAALGLAGVGFAALARDGFPTAVPAAVSLGLAAAVGVRARQPGGPGTPTDESPRAGRSQY